MGPDVIRGGTMLAKPVARLLFLGICLFCIGILPGRAQDNAPASTPSAPPAAGPVPAQNDALVTFHGANEAIVGVLLQTGELPTLENPVYAGAVSQAFDVSLLEKDLPMPDLMGACNRANATEAVYIIHDAQKEDLDPFAIQPRLKREPNARISKLKSENYLRFQNEQIAALGFLLACRTRELERLKTYLGQMPHDEMVVFRLSFGDFQDSLVETVTYHVEALRDPIRPENRQAVLDLLTQYIDPLTAGMNKQSRRTTAATIAQVVTDPSVTPAERAMLKKVSLALKRASCGPVCSFH